MELAVSVGSSITNSRRNPSSADSRRHLPRRRKLHILRFAFRGKSSVIPLLLLSPPPTAAFHTAPSKFCKHPCSAPATIPHNSARVFSERFCVRKRQFFAGILCVFQGKLAHFWHKRSAENRRRIVTVLSQKDETCEFLFFSTPPFYGSIKP